MRQVFEEYDTGRVAAGKTTGFKVGGDEDVASVHNKEITTSSRSVAIDRAGRCILLIVGGQHAGACTTHSGRLYPCAESQDFSPSGSGAEELLDRMAARIAADAGALRHPDRVGLCHRRLAILDLTPTGAQPMTDSKADLALSYNGEIFNYREISAELSSLGYRFRGTSDTEMILNAYRQWGISCITRFIDVSLSPCGTVGAETFPRSRPPDRHFTTSGGRHLPLRPELLLLDPDFPARRP
jgi:hypothetical protein